MPSRPASICPRVLATATALPPHRYPQSELVELARRILPDLTLDTEQLERFFRRVQVRSRHLALPMEAYTELGGLEGRARAWLEVALDLGQRSVEGVLKRSNTEAADVRHFMTTTVTGFAVPTLDARLMNRIPFPSDLKRLPAFGLGCVGGSAGVARVADYLRAFPDQAAILLSVELCSLTVQRNDASSANLISMALFGDGAAAVLMVGAEHERAGEGRPIILDSRSVFFPDTERAMGWDVVDTGFKVVLDESVPDVVRRHLRTAVDGFLGRHGLSRGDLRSWVCHPGGPKIMAAVQESLELPSSALQPAREGLERLGNLSSASVLFLLDEFRAKRPPPGSFGLMLAMGPAFCAELVLLQW